MALTDKLRDLANSIRAKTGTTGKLTIDQMTAMVTDLDIPGTGGEVVEPIVEPLAVTKNGTYTAPDGVDGYSPVTVNVPIPDGYIQPSGTLDITENTTHDVKNYASVNVNVPIPDGYIQPSGTLDITENGTCDVKNYASVNVNVAGSGGDSQLDAFLEGTITEVNSNAANVEAYAFRNRDELVTVNLPNAKYINMYAFYGCDILKTVNIPNAINIGSYCFQLCESLEEITLPKVELLNSYAFQSCSKLKKVDAFAVKEVGSKVFYSCSKLESLILRRTTSVATLVDKNAFDISGISRATGYVYVPAALVDSYKVDTNWSNFADKIRAIEDYPEICGG